MLLAARKLFDLLSLKERTHLGALIVIVLGVAVMETVGVASIMPFIAVVDSPDVVETNPWLKLVYEYFGFTETNSFLFSLGLVVLGLLVLSNSLKALSVWGSLNYDNKLNYVLSRRLLAQYMARPYTFFLSRNTSDMGKNVLTEVRNVITSVLSAGVKLLSGTLVCICLLTLLIVIDPLIAILIMTVLGSAYSVMYLLTRRRLAQISREQVVANSMKYRFAGEALSGIKDLKILRRELSFLERFAEHAERHAVNNVSAGVISQLPKFGMEVIAFGGILVMMLYLLDSEGNSGRMISVLALYAFAGYRLLPAVQEIFLNLATMRVGLSAIEILHRDFTEGAGASDPEEAMVRPDGLEPLPLRKELQLRDVSFAYREGLPLVLDKINLTIHRHAAVGIVGATGAGKTTVVDVILGLLVPSSGEILVDGAPLRNVEMVRWQRSVGYVSQSIFLSDDTVARNIAFGVPEAEIDMVAVIRAARIANLDEFITKQLPHGYHTAIGERGVRLSGGQRQRIGIARALYHDPEVLILDEATSALDGVTEEAVVEALRVLAGKKTIIMIAHRLTTVQECDVIYLIDQGRVVSQGTHDELIRTSSWFKAAARVGG